MKSVQLRDQGVFYLREKSLLLIVVKVYQPGLDFGCINLDTNRVIRVLLDLDISLDLVIVNKSPLDALQRSAAQQQRVIL